MSLLQYLKYCCTESCCQCCQYNEMLFGWQVLKHEPFSVAATSLWKVEATKTWPLFCNGENGPMNHSCGQPLESGSCAGVLRKKLLISCHFSVGDGCHWKVLHGWEQKNEHNYRGSVNGMQRSNTLGWQLRNMITNVHWEVHSLETSTQWSLCTYQKSISYMMYALQSIRKKKTKNTITL